MTFAGNTLETRDTLCTGTFTHTSLLGICDKKSKTRVTTKGDEYPLQLLSQKLILVIDNRFVVSVVVR